MKRCSKCGMDKPLSEFGRNRASKSGLQSRCKPCHVAGVMASQRRHPEALKARQREYVLAHPEKTRANWARENRRRAAFAREARLTPDELAVKQAVDREFRMKRWNARHPLGHRVNQNHRRARLAGVEGSFNEEQLAARIAYYAGRCWMCGMPADQIDHVIPLALLGPNWPSNLRPACADCNDRKHTMHPRDLQIA